MRFGSSSRNVSLVLGTLAIFLAMSVPLGAQETLGAITGTVKDTSGGVVADASVRARNTGTNQEITQHTDSNGFYSAQNLPIGDYEVTFSKEGFKTETHTQVYVSGNRTVTVDGTSAGRRSQRHGRSHAVVPDESGGHDERLCGRPE